MNEKPGARQRASKRKNENTTMEKCDVLLPSRPPLHRPVDRNILQVWPGSQQLPGTLPWSLGPISAEVFLVAFFLVAVSMLSHQVQKLSFLRDLCHFCARVSPCKPSAAARVLGSEASVHTWFGQYGSTHGCSKSVECKDLFVNTMPETRQAVFALLR